MIGGLCRQTIIRANTATTIFRADLQDEDNATVLNYGYHQGEINDHSLALPMMGQYTLNITNASPNDTFAIQLLIQE